MNCKRLSQLTILTAATAILGACTSAQVRETAQYAAAAVFVVAVEVHDLKHDDAPEYKPGPQTSCDRSCKQRSESLDSAELFSGIYRDNRKREAADFDTFMQELAAAEELSADEILLQVAPPPKQ